MEASLTADEKIALIHENLQEILRPEIIEDVIRRQNRPLIIYWGTATTGRPHCGYFVPIIKIAHFLRAGCTVKLLLADIHGFLDNLKAPIELIKLRAEYYRFVITALLKSVNVPIDNLEFVLGSSYQLSERYTMDLFRLSSVVTEHDSKKAGSEVVKQVSNPTLSGLLYPLMQALDEEHLGVDAQFGGVDQRKIFALAGEQLPKIGYKERAHLMNPMVPGLQGGKMSASDPDSKIDLLDTEVVTRRKLNKAPAAPREVEGNGIISFVEYVLLPASALKSGGKAKFVIEQKEREPRIYHDIESLKSDYRQDTISPQILKPAVTTALLAMLAPIQADFEKSSEWQDLTLKAYPPTEVKKKDKKVKDKGSRHPGAAVAMAKVEAHNGEGVQVQPDGSVEGPSKGEVSLGSGGVESAMEAVKVGKDPTQPK